MPRICLYDPNEQAKCDAITDVCLPRIKDLIASGPPLTEDEAEMWATGYVMGVYELTTGKIAITVLEKEPSNGEAQEQQGQEEGQEGRQEEGPEEEG